MFMEMKTIKDILNSNRVEFKPGIISIIGKTGTQKEEFALYLANIITNMRRNSLVYNYDTKTKITHIEQYFDNNIEYCKNSVINRIANNLEISSLINLLNELVSEVDDIKKSKKVVIANISNIIDMMIAKSEDSDFVNLSFQVNTLIKESVPLLIANNIYLILITDIKDEISDKLPLHVQNEILATSYIYQCNNVLILEKTEDDKLKIKISKTV